MAKAPKPIKVKFGKGVLARDNRTPYAPSTITATSADGMMYPCTFSHETVARLLADDDVREIRVVDVNNRQSTITKTWIEKKPSRLASMLAEQPLPA